jgi:hypothetical protein
VPSSLLIVKGIVARCWLLVRSSYSLFSYNSIPFFCLITFKLQDKFIYWVAIFHV